MTSAINDNLINLINLEHCNEDIGYSIDRRPL